MKNLNVNRRDFFRKIVAGLGGLSFLADHPWAKKIFGDIDTVDAGPAKEIPKRVLGLTRETVTILGLGGEGVLRTSGRNEEAGLVIQHALNLGINYFDSAPAYDQSQDYYGENLGQRRQGIFLASKTHERSRDGCLRLLEDSLRRIKTDHLDLWQLHDLRTQGDLDEIFDEKNGAIKALEEAREQKMVRFFGVTGHHDPKILSQALKRYPFHTCLTALNVADRVRDSFIEIVLPLAQEKQVGVIGMKVLARGRVMEAGISAQDAIHYVLSYPVTTVIIGCETPEEVEENVNIVKAFAGLSRSKMEELEKLAEPYAEELCFYKK